MSFIGLCFNCCSTNRHIVYVFNCSVFQLLFANLSFAKLSFCKPSFYEPSDRFRFSLFQLINHWNLITENWVCASRFRISFQIWFGFFNFERFDFNWLMVEQAKVKMLIVQWEGAAFRERKRNLISRPLRIIIISLNAKQEHLQTVINKVGSD
jgi:hypothetical protein